MANVVVRVGPQSTEAGSKSVNPAASIVTTSATPLTPVAASSLVRVDVGVPGIVSASGHTYPPVATPGALTPRIIM